MSASPLNQALKFHAAGRLADAEAGYRRVLAQTPDHPEALNMLGVLHAQKGDAQSGLSLIAKALDIKPKYAEAAFNLGRLFHDAGQMQQAILAYTRAVRTDRKHAKAWTNLAAAFEAAGKMEAADLCVAEGLKNTPKNENLYINGCRFHKLRNDFRACLDLAERGLKHLPESARLWIHKAEACFALGKFDDAWNAYKWRFKTSENPNVAPSYPIPEWQGENLAGKTILVWTEQGPGEVLMFAPCLDEVIAQADKCIVVTTDRFIPFLKRTFPGADVQDGATYNPQSSAADVQCSQIDLARWLRRSWDDFPAEPQRVQCDETRRDAFRATYKQLSGGQPVVGIAWRSRDIKTAEQKSTALDSWRPILSIPGVTFVSLQYGDAAPEVNEASQALDIPIHVDRELDPLKDMDGHLAQVAAVDLVVSTSNTLVHAAGAQGVPAWCLVPQMMGEGLRWQWFSGRNDSPWYPSVTLYRQEKQGDWSAPIGEAALDLLTYAQDHTEDIDAASHAAALAFSFHKAGQSQNAGRFAAHALRQGRQTASLYRLAAGGHQAEGDPETAVSLLTEALTHDTSEFGALIDRAAIHADGGHLDLAETDLVAARKVAPDAPEPASNLGRVLRLQGRTEEALAMYQEATAADPKLSGAKLSAGTCLYELGRTAEAIATFEGLIQRQEQVTDAASTLAMTLLNAGNFAQGWPLFRHRLARQGNNVSYHLFAAPMWNGEDITGKKVLLWSEQGIGEELLLATMIPGLAAACSKLTVLCSARMVPVFKRSFPAVKVAERDEPLPAEGIDPALDFQMSLSDAGQFLRPSFESFAHSESRGVLQAHPKKRKQLRADYLERKSDAALVGLSWHSATPDLGPLKSMPARVAAEIAKQIDATIVSLQYQPSAEDVAVIAEACGETWIVDEAIDPLTSMEDSIAQVAAMDCVVTISNTTAHTAGALGIPCVLLVPKYTGRHWYWFRTQSDDCVWYPSVRLVEIENGDDWAAKVPAAIEFVRQTLSAA